MPGLRGFAFSHNLVYDVSAGDALVTVHRVAGKEMAKELGHHGASPPPPRPRSPAAAAQQGCGQAGRTGYIDIAGRLLAGDCL